MEVRGGEVGKGKGTKQNGKMVVGREDESSEGKRFALPCPFLDHSPRELATSREEKPVSLTVSPFVSRKHVGRGRREY